MIELKVPDIGDFKDVEIIEILVKPGDTVKLDQSLVTVESDKASMEIPATQAGIIQKILVKLGDKISQGSVIAEISELNTAPEKNAASAAFKQEVLPLSIEVPAIKITAPEEKPIAKTSDATLCDLIVIGGGPGGYSAAFRAADLGLQVVLVERYATLGGVCLNVGCIPSKALLHVSAAVRETAALAQQGIQFGKPQLDLEKLRSSKDQVIKKLTTGLAAMAKMRKVKVVQGVAQFTDAQHIRVQYENGQTENFQFKQAIIAAGSMPVQLPFLPKDPRIIDSTGALQLKSLPKKMLVIGGGIIGLEMATVYATFGSKIDVVEMSSQLMPGTDLDLVKVWQKFNQNYFSEILLNTQTTQVEAREEGLLVQFKNLQTQETFNRQYDAILVAVGRKPNGHTLHAQAAGVKISDNGFIPIDSQMRTNIAHIFAIGDIADQPMLAHKAVHQGHVAADVAAGHNKVHFDAQVIPSVAYTDPEIAWVGLTEDFAKKNNIAYQKSIFPWSASGRAIANHRDEGFTKILYEPETQRIIGGAIVGVHAGDMIGEFALAIEMGSDITDLAKTIHPHPTLGESMGMVAEVALGSCTDLPPQTSTS